MDVEGPPEHHINIPDLRAVLTTLQRLERKVRQTSHWLTGRAALPVSRGDQAPVRWDERVAHQFLAPCLWLPGRVGLRSHVSKSGKSPKQATATCKSKGTRCESNCANFVSWSFKLLPSPTRTPYDLTLLSFVNYHWESSLFSRAQIPLGFCWRLPNLIYVFVNRSFWICGWCSSSSSFAQQGVKLVSSAENNAECQRHRFCMLLCISTEFCWRRQWMVLALLVCFGLERRMMAYR